MAKEFTFNPLSYLVPLLFWVTAWLTRDLNELPWVTFVAVGIGVLFLTLMIFHHRSIFITSETLRIQYLMGKEVVIHKSEVDSYKRISVRNKARYVDWLFQMKSGEELKVTPEMMQKERDLIGAIDSFCVTLQRDP